MRSQAQRPLLMHPVNPFRNTMDPQVFAIVAQLTAAFMIDLRGAYRVFLRHSGAQLASCLGPAGQITCSVGHRYLHRQAGAAEVHLRTAFQTSTQILVCLIFIHFSFKLSDSSFKHTFTFYVLTSASLLTLKRNSICKKFWTHTRTSAPRRR